MKKYLIYIAVGVVGAVVWGTAALADDIPIKRKGYAPTTSSCPTCEPLVVSGACASSIVSSVRSVYPSANIADVWQWHLFREDQNTWRYEGDYRATMTVAEWFAARQVGGPQCISRAGSTCTLPSRRVEGVLNAAQVQASAGILANCLGGLAAGDLVEVDVKRIDSGTVHLYSIYLDSVSTQNDAADLDAAGKLYEILVPEE